ncbi:DUF6119 family protein [Bacillus cereus]|uniref:DUF6119 family protein n=1 Tax=Bacillus cereus TaxID=1396 RepID=UPI000BF77FC7|nr:DUF6119 family protein [Bacillus cereus]PFI17697.1 hypothetical protein COI75_19525 [Bacillus cereus]
MAKVNIYKISNTKHGAFERNLEENLAAEVSKTISQAENDQLEYEMIFTLYKHVPSQEKDIPWKWILEAFEEDVLQVTPQPKVVVKITYGEDMYALTFGHSHFLVDKYCDYDFAFSFARKMEYEGIKTTALTSPNSQRNKTINTYIDYKELEFDSGASFTKLKAKVIQSNEVKHLYNQLIEVGSSLKFDLKQDDLESVCEVLLHIVKILDEEDKCKIPVFTRVTSSELLSNLNRDLQEAIRRGQTTINISEVDIIGATEIFNNNDAVFKLWYGAKRKTISELNYDQIRLFAEEKELNLGDILLDIKVQSLYNGTSVRSDKIRNLIEYVDDTRRCILTKGNWYYFNDDYQQYLEDSISEIKTIYCPDYDFTKEIHEEFLERKYAEENHKYPDMTEEEIKKKLKNIYYAENVFNLLREQNDDFQNFDREEERINAAKVELMDLYKDKTMYAVKIGNTSGKLCYAVDQSISSLRLYKHGVLQDMPEIERVAIWLVLERASKLTLIDGEPNLNELNMIMLKNKLDIWKKEVRLQGYEPIVYINYRVQS